jgi:hypothetical protein
MTASVSVPQRRGQNGGVMRLLNNRSALAVAAAFLLGIVADLVVPDAGMSGALTRMLGVSSIGLAVWVLVRIAQ